MQDRKVIALLLAVFHLAQHGFADAKYPALTLIRKIPHTGYSEGLDFYKGFLWHALPAKILKIDPKDGSVVTSFAPATTYSESITWLNDKLWNVSFKTNGIYEGKWDGANSVAFTQKGKTPEDLAWGITHDSKHLILTGNFSSNLYFLNPKTLSVVRKIQVPVKDLEDLAWDGVGIWTSSFSEHPGHLFRVDPKSGAVQGMFKLHNPEECPVIDGIAVVSEGMWVTGKECPSIYLFKKPGSDQFVPFPKK